MRNIEAAAAPLVLYDTEGDKQEFFASPWSDKDFKEFEFWLREYLYTNASEAAQNLPDDVRVKVLAQVLLDVSAVTWDSEKSASVVGTVEGLSRLVWQCLKRRHPNLTHANLKEMLFSEKNQNLAKNVSNANRVFNSLHPVAEDNGTSKKGQKSRKKKSTAG